MIAAELTMMRMIERTSIPVVILATSGLRNKSGLIIKKITPQRVENRRSNLPMNMAEVTAFLSIISITLSIGNTLYIYFWESRVHMRLTIGIRRVYDAAGLETSQRILRWSVVNRSAFTVYIEEIGFCDHWHAMYQAVPARLIRKMHSPDEAVLFPCKLNSREGVTFIVSHSSQTEEMKKYTRMYMKTSCGYVTTAKIPSTALFGI